MKKIFLIIGIVMFSLSVLADGPHYGFMSTPRQNYGNNPGYGYSRSDGRSYQSQSSVRGSAFSRGTMIDNASSQSFMGGTQASVNMDYEPFGDSDGGTGGNRANEGVLNDAVDPDGKSPIGDAIIPLLLLLLPLVIVKIRKH